MCFYHQRKCIVDELRKQTELDLDVLSSGFAATLPYVSPYLFSFIHRYDINWRRLYLHLFFSFSVTMLENLSNVSFRAILDHIQTHFVEFLRLPYYKQMNLADRAITELVKHQHEQYKCIYFSDAQGLVYSRKFKEVKCYQNLLLQVISSIC